MKKQAMKMFVCVCVAVLSGITGPAQADPVQQKKLTADDGAVGDWFGYSVGLSGDYAVAGAYHDDDNGTDSGSAYVFYRNEGGDDNWGQVAKLTASDGAVRDYFGGLVGISGDYAIAGAYGKNSYTGSA